jgi:hypothetical protein
VMDVDRGVGHMRVVPVALADRVALPGIEGPVPGLATRSVVPITAPEATADYRSSAGRGSRL